MRVCLLLWGWRWRFAEWLETISGSDRRPARQFLGRLFSATASLALGMRMADTQCGAKLFRVTPQFKQIISEPFAARWIFDVRHRGPSCAIAAQPSRKRRPL